MASGIAASLGLAADTNETDSSTNPPGGPLSDLEDFSEPSETNNQTFETRSGGGVKRPRESSSTENSPAKKVSKLAMEWTEDEDDEEEQMPNTNST